MTTPETNKAPIAIAVSAGNDYWWCTRGNNAKQPFCDGSHKGSGKGPYKYTATADATLWFCVCKKTGNRPLCDGSYSLQLTGKVVRNGSACQIHTYFVVKVNIPSQISPGG